MDTSIATFSVTDLRHKTNTVLKEAVERGYAYLLRRSKPAAAVVDIEYLAALQESYEDYMDILEFDRTVKLPRIPLGEHKRRKIRGK
jgi:prevent-host-death family protein